MKREHFSSFPTRPRTFSGHQGGHIVTLSQSISFTDKRLRRKSEVEIKGLKSVSGLQKVKFFCQGFFEFLNLNSVDL